MATAHESNYKMQSTTMMTEKEEARQRATKRVLAVVNCAMLVLGCLGTPLLLRLYFKDGGRRLWLTSWLQTAGWPLNLLALAAAYVDRRRRHGAADAKTHFITPRLFVACAVIGVLTGADDYIYSYGLEFLPVSTSAILIATQLAFTAFFAFLVVRQRFTAYSINAVALLTAGAAVLGMHASSDRPPGVTNSQYAMGFVLTIGAAALYGVVLPLVQLMYQKAQQKITYSLVLEMQMVMGLFATIFCTFGLLINKDLQAMPREAEHYALGGVRYYTVVVCAAILSQFFFIGASGVIFSVNTLLAGIIIAVCIPVVEVLGVIFFHEKFSSEKGVSLILSLWGLASYSYGEYQDMKKEKIAVAAAESCLTYSTMQRTTASTRTCSMIDVGV